MSADVRHDPTGIGLPDSCRRIGAGGHDAAPVGTEHGAHDGAAVATELDERTARARFPHARRAVVAGRDDAVASRAERGPGHPTTVPPQLSNELPGADVPDASREIPTRDEQPRARA